MASTSLEQYGVVRDCIIQSLCREPMEYQDILRKCGGNVDKALLRRILADMVREGLVERTPHYERRRMVFSVKSSACR